MRNIFAFLFCFVCASSFAADAEISAATNFCNKLRKQEKNRCLSFIQNKAIDFDTLTFCTIGEALGNSSDRVSCLETIAERILTTRQKKLCSGGFTLVKTRVDCIAEILDAPLFDEYLTEGCMALNDWMKIGCYKSAIRGVRCEQSRLREESSTQNH